MVGFGNRERRTGVADRVTIITGPAATSAERLIADCTQPYDFVFIDADKPSNHAVSPPMVVRLSERGR